MNKGSKQSDNFKYSGYYRDFAIHYTLNTNLNNLHIITIRSLFARSTTESVNSFFR